MGERRRQVKQAFLWILLGPVAMIFLWGFTLYEAHNAPKHFFRANINADALAYPLSDALEAYRGGLAILTGDGWVNWWKDTRWTTYKPGWNAFLAALAIPCGRIPSEMQLIVTFLMGIIGPAFYFAATSFARGPASRCAALVVTLLFLHFPQGETWWFLNAFMTEGPTLAFNLLIIGLAMRVALRARWTVPNGIALGLLAAAVCLVREQTRYSVVAAVLILGLCAMRQPRRATAFFLALLAAFLFVVGPNYAKTSWHIGQVYTGTSHRAVKTMMDYPKLCRLYPEPPLTDAEKATEASQIEAYMQRSMYLAKKNFEEPGRIAVEALKNLSLYAFTSPARAVGTEGLNLKDGFGGDFTKRAALPVPLLIACLIAALAGLWMAWGQAGYAALIPLAYAVAYMVPNTVFSYYLERFGAPISYLGWLYFAFAVPILFTNQRRMSGLAKMARMRLSLPPVGRFLRGCVHYFGMRKKHVLLGACTLALWIGLSAAGLVWFDTRPLPSWKPEDLLANPKANGALSAAGIPADAALTEEIRAAMAGNGRSGRIKIASVFLPVVNRQTQADGTEVTTTSLSIAFPWKTAGEYSDETVQIPETPPEDLVNGEFCVVVCDNPPRRGQAKTILPIRWAEDR